MDEESEKFKHLIQQTSDFKNQENSLSFNGSDHTNNKLYSSNYFSILHNSQSFLFNKDTSIISDGLHALQQISTLFSINSCDISIASMERILFLIIQPNYDLQTTFSTTLDKIIQIKELALILIETLIKTTNWATVFLIEHNFHQFLIDQIHSDPTIIPLQHLTCLIRILLNHNNQIFIFFMKNRYFDFLIHNLRLDSIESKSCTWYLQSIHSILISPYFEQTFVFQEIIPILIYFFNSSNLRTKAISLSTLSVIIIYESNELFLHLENLSSNIFQLLSSYIPSQEFQEDFELFIQAVFSFFNNYLYKGDFSLDFLKPLLDFFFTSKFFNTLKGYEKKSIEYLYHLLSTCLATNYSSALDIIFSISQIGQFTLDTMENGNFSSKREANLFSLSLLTRTPLETLMDFFQQTDILPDLEDLLFSEDSLLLNTAMICFGNLMINSNSIIGKKLINDFVDEYLFERLEELADDNNELIRIPAKGLIQLIQNSH